MLLVADVGNTETTLGLFEGEILRANWRVMSDVPRTPDEFGLLVGQLIASRGFALADVAGAAVGSVVPGVTAALAEGIATATQAPVRVIDSLTPLPVRLDVDEPRSVGADRIINTLAASRLFGRDCIVVDLGTATTFDCITGDGVFLGGIIAPGVRTSAETLFRRAAKLSATELVAPESPIGRRTDEAIRAGVVFGAAELIGGLVRRLTEAWPRPEVPLVIATGGLAAALAPHCPAIQRVVPDLTLVGLRMAWEWLEENG